MRFKGYGFFLPVDSTGREAWVQGVVVETPSEKVGFTASGVRLVCR